jgi:hypothetical protein
LNGRWRSDMKLAIPWVHLIALCFAMLLLIMLILKIWDQFKFWLWDNPRTQHNNQRTNFTTFIIVLNRLMHFVGTTRSPSPMWKIFQSRYYGRSNVHWYHHENQKLWLLVFPLVGCCHCSMWFLNRFSVHWFEKLKRMELEFKGECLVIKKQCIL